MKRQRIVKTSMLKSLLLIATVAAGVAITPGLSRAAAETGSCSTDLDSRQLDFWLGQWTISGPGSAPNATSTVTTSLDGCVIVESWDGGRGHRGDNLGYSADDKSWHGMFADNQGRVHVFVDGKVSDGKAEYSGPSRGSNGEKFLNRVRIVRVGPDNGANLGKVFR